MNVNVLSILSHSLRLFDCQRFDRADWFDRFTNQRYHDALGCKSLRMSFGSVCTRTKMISSRLFNRSFSIRSALQPRRLAKITLGTTVLTGVGFLSYTLYESGAEWEKFRRTSYFWSRMLPVYLHYRSQQLYFQFFPPKSTEEEDLAWSSLHEKYCDYVFNVVLHQRGVYIKLGQIASTRPDVVPKPYLKKLAQLQVCGFSSSLKLHCSYLSFSRLGRCTSSTWRICSTDDRTSLRSTTRRDLL